MAKQKVVSNKCLPTRLPILGTVVLWLFLDRLKVPGIAIGVCWTLMGSEWIAAIYGICKETHTDLRELQ